MTNKPLATPLLFLIFNRPDTTQRVFDQIRKARPNRLFVAADGPREGVPRDAELCDATRAIIKRVDWSCELRTNFRERNVGLKTAVRSAIDWFFQNVEEGIILEDDCLPSQSFFWFCQALLEEYRNDNRIMMISGSNFQFGRKRGTGTYYFSRLPSIWGWASWRRAWRHFDSELKTLPRFLEERQIRNVVVDRISQRFWLREIRAVYNGANSWAFAWAYAIFTQNGLCIYPNENLVGNIGFGRDAVHATNLSSRFANMATQQIEEIDDPVFVLADKDADEFHTRLFARQQLRDKGFAAVLRCAVEGVVRRTISAVVGERWRL